jgi:hypothetical protein
MLVKLRRSEMRTYIRFQTALRCSKTSRPLGIFGAAGRVEDVLDLPDVTRGWLRSTLEWFNENLTFPRLNPGEWRSIFWFRDEAQSVVAHVWELIAILRDEGVSVCMQRTSKPGQIVYEDNFQIAAVPNGLRHRSCWVA